MPPSLVAVDAGEALPVLLSCPVREIALWVRFDLATDGRHLQGWHRITPMFLPGAAFEIALGDLSRPALFGFGRQRTWGLDHAGERRLVDVVRHETAEIVRRYARTADFVENVDIAEADIDDAPELFEAIRQARILGAGAANRQPAPSSEFAWLQACRQNEGS